MGIIIIILIIVGIIGVYLSTRFLSKTFKVITKLLLLLIAILILITAFVYKDMSELRRGFITKNNTFFLYKDNQLYTAITLKPMTTTNLSLNSFEYFTKEEIKRAEQDLNNKNYKTLLRNNYRIFIINPRLLKKNYSLDFGITLHEEELLSIIRSNESFKVMAMKTQQHHNLSIDDIKKGFENSYGSEEKLRGYLFAGLLTNYFQKQEPGELVRSIKANQLVVYPETISFKVIKYVPSWVLTKK